MKNNTKQSIRTSAFPSSGCKKADRIALRADKGSMSAGKLPEAVFAAAILLFCLLFASLGAETTVESVKPAMEVAALEVQGETVGTISPEETASLAEAAGNSDIASDETLIEVGLETRADGGELPEGETFSAKKVMNILVIGTDMRLANTEDRGRADMVMLMSVNSSEKTVKLTSFERALGMPLPGQKDSMLNNLMNEGGPELIVEDISKCFLVDIDAYVQVDYDALVYAVDAIGGIDLTFDQQEANNFNARITLDVRSDFVAREGLNHLGGYETMVYCRLRDGDDNWGRQSRTRAVMKAIIEKVPTFRLRTLNELVENILPFVNTDLSLLDIGRLILKVPAMLKSDVQGMSIPEKNNVWIYYGKNDDAMYGCNFEAETNRLHEFINSQEP